METKEEKVEITRKEISMNAEESYSIKEQIQEDIIAYMSPLLDREYEFTNLNVDDLCQIVVDNFREWGMN